MLDGEQLARAECGACLRGVLRRHIVRMRTIRAFLGEREHARAEGRENPSRFRRRLDREERRVVHSFQVRTHRLDRGGVCDTAHAFDHRLVAHADAEHEPLGKRLLDGQPRRVQRGRVARVQRDDAGREDEALGRAEEQRRRDQRIASHGFGKPDRGVVELLELLHDLACPARRLLVEARNPKADGTKLHRRNTMASSLRKGP